MSTCAEPRTAILIFARAPVPGAAKTRLIPHIGAEAAARLHERMTERALVAACDARIGPVQLWCEPTTAHPFFLRCSQTYRITLHIQIGDSLGERLLHAHRSALDTHDRVLLIGTDCPLLDAQCLRAAAAGLRTHDAVIVPAEDGGYVLLGLARPCDATFSKIDWGSSQVFGQTMTRLGDARRTCWVMDALWDVDRPEDYWRLSIHYPELTSSLAMHPDSCDPGLM